MSFWTQETWQLAYSFRLNAPDSKCIIFESSFRYLASLSARGSVEVWRLKGLDAKLDWSLEFKSVSRIEANAALEN